MTRVLVIEDHADLAFGLYTNLEIEGYEVRVARDGSEGLQMAVEQPPDLVVLDLMLPGMDGFEVIRRLRSSPATMPILVLSARGEELDKVRALRSGADDYLTKPFGLMELLARIEALLRRGTERPAELYRFGRVEVDARTRTVLRDGQPVSLTPKEFGLLLALLRRRGAVASRQALMREVWGHSAAVASRTVDTHVAELRRKLGDDGQQPKHLLTVRKSGYRLDL